MKWSGRMSVGLALLLVALVLLFIGLTVVVEFPLTVAFGWIYFLIRTLPNVQSDWAAIGLAMTALLLLTAGIHLAGSRWTRNPTGLKDDSLIRQAEPKSRLRWKPRWTACLVAALLLIFTAGISVVGIIHQVIWMAAGTERMVSSNQYQFSGPTHSKNNLKQIGVGLHHYHDANETLPAGGTFDRDGRPMHSAMTAFLPFLEQQTLFNSIDLTQPWNAPGNRIAFESRIAIYEFPSNVPNPELNRVPKTPALTNYAGNVRVLPLGRSLKISEITDGSSNTILFGEVNAGLRPWGDPLNLRDPAKGINQGPTSFGSPFFSGASVLLVDGSVRSISETTASSVLKALATPDSGDTVGDF